MYSGRKRTSLAHVVVSEDRIKGHVGDLESLSVEGRHGRTVRAERLAVLAKPSLPKVVVDVVERDYDRVPSVHVRGGEGQDLHSLVRSREDLLMFAQEMVVGRAQTQNRDVSISRRFLTKPARLKGNMVGESTYVGASTRNASLPGQERRSERGAEDNSRLGSAA